MNIEKLRKLLDLENKDIAPLFGLNRASYVASTARDRYDAALVNFYNLLEEKGYIRDNSDTSNKQENQ